MESQVTDICRLAQKLNIDELGRVIVILQGFLEDASEGDLQAQGEAEAEAMAKEQAEQEEQEASDEEYYYSQGGPEF